MFDLQEILDGIFEMGFVKPSKIQDQTFVIVITRMENTSKASSEPQTVYPLPTGRSGPCLLL